MKTFNIVNGPQNVSAVIQGCMRMPGLSKEDASKAAVAIAWILRHPAKMQAIVGTMKPAHIEDICKASDVKLSHHDWYTLYLASGKYLP